MKKFCENCLKDENCQLIEKEVTENINNNKITYLKKYYICDECKNIFYDDLYDYNINLVNNKLREINNIITVAEINEILKKYSIGKKPLSYILGFGEITIIRYLNGTNPSKEHSEILKGILNNPYFYELFLIANKDKISKVAYKKSLGKTKQIQLTYENSKLYNSALYMISKSEDITPLSLQKLLFFAEGISKKLISYNLFEEEPEAWIYGPVYKDIYECFSYYKDKSIDYNEILKEYNFDLNNQEKDFLDKIILYFGCYSGNVLKEMSHLTNPWIETRVGLNNNEISNRIIDLNLINSYFDEVCEYYEIKTFDDIEKYSKYLFNEVIDKMR